MTADPTTPEALVEGRRLLNLLMIAEIAHSKDPACMGEWFGWLIRNGEALLKAAEDRQWWERLAVQRGSEIDSAVRRAEIAEQERDKVVDQRNEAWNSEGDCRERAERAETCHAWPKTTPSGHVYEQPTTYDELRSRHFDAAQAVAEGWDAAEHPPEPTWEMLGIAHREVERLTRRGTTMQVWGLPFFGRHRSRGGDHG